MTDTAQGTRNHRPGVIFQHSDISQALLVFILCATVYSLSYSGTFITDDEHILASRTLSMAFDERINNNRVFGNSRLFFLSNLAPEYAASAMNVEPAQGVLGSVLARVSVLLGVGRVQTIFLLNIWVTAFTAVMIFAAARCLEYSKLTAGISAVLFGLSTNVWPYARTYFRDPLAMLFLALAWVSALVIGNGVLIDRSRLSKILTWLGLFGGLLAGILTKNTIVIAIPAIGIYLLARKFKDFAEGNIRQYILENWRRVLLLVGSALVLLSGWVLFVPLRGIFSRFSVEYYIQLARIFLSTPHPKFLEAILGPLISPGKSIFIYSPILVLALIGSCKKWKIAWPAWLYLLLLLIGQALFYDDEWPGHINWGLRFVLPALPPLFIAVVPAIDAWIKTRKGITALAVFGGVSTLIQVVGVLPPVRQFYVELSKIDPALIKSGAIWNLTHSPILWHVTWLLRGGALDLAFARVGGSAIPVLAGFLLVLFLVGLSLIRPGKKSLPLLSLGLLAGTTFAMLFLYKTDPEYSLERPDLRSSQELIASQGNSDDLVIIKSYSAQVWLYWMNWAGPDDNWISLPLTFPQPELIEEYQRTGNPEIALDEATLSLLRGISDDNNRVWLVLPGDTPGASLGIEVEWLRKRSISSSNWTIEGNSGAAELYLFEFAQQ